MDSHYLYLFNQTWTSPGLDWVMAIFSSFDLWAPFFILALLLTFVFGGFRARSMVVCLAIIIGLIDGVLTHSMKKWVARPRPNDVRSDVRIVDLAKIKPRFLALGLPLKIKMSRASDQPVAGNSFPSGHTSNMFAVATILTVFYRWKGLPAFLPAAVVGYSRIYVGSHWPGDIVVSALLGSGEAALLLCLLNALWQKWGIRWSPAHPSLIG